MSSHWVHNLDHWNRGVIQALRSLYVSYVLTYEVVAGKFSINGMISSVQVRLIQKFWNGDNSWKGSFGLLFDHSIYFFTKGGVPTPGQISTLDRRIWIDLSGIQINYFFYFENPSLFCFEFGVLVGISRLIWDFGNQTILIPLIYFW